MKKLFLLPVLMLFCFRLAYSQNYIPVSSTQLINTIESINTGVDIRFKVDEKEDVYAIDQMVSIDRIDVSPEGLYVVSGYLFPERANEFVSLRIPVLMVDLSQPKAFNMATSVSQMLAWDKYPTYQTYLDVMSYFQTTYPNLCRIDTILETTPGGRKILAARITSNATQDKPQFFYSSTMHGDETAGYYMMIRLIHYLLSNYGTDARITNIVDNIDLWICPNANPDGTYKSGNHTLGNNPVSTRTNYNGKDLNRNYPDPRTGNPTGTYAPIQPETYAFMDFAASHQFVMGANYHGGTEVINYPWDAWTSSQKPHADKLWWVGISREYADTVQANSPSGYFIAEGNGVTNGGDWYVITGGRQDYMNWWHLCRELTAEVSTNKAPGTEVIANYWDYNYKSMLRLLEQTLYGFRGIVTDAETGLPIRAKVYVNNHDADSSHVYSFLPTGNYHRPIKAGTYSVAFSAPCYQSQTHEITVEESQCFRLDVALESGAKADFIALDSNTCFTNISFVNTSDSTITDNLWEWDFGDGNTSNLKDPTHIYASGGVYSVKLKMTNSCGQVDSIVKVNYINIENPEAPIVENEFRCGSGVLTLTAQADYLVRWFDAPLAGSLLHVGNEYTTEVLTETTNFYVENYKNPDTLLVGDSRSNNGGGYFTGTNTHGLYFNAIQDFRLLSVKMNSQSAQNRTIIIIDNNNDTIQQLVRYIPAGQSIVLLDVDIPQGNAYRITVNGTNGLYRNNVGCSYPYTQQGLVEIYNSTAGTTGLDYYYFFYDWQVQARPCISERVMVQAIINDEVPSDIAFLSGLDTVCVGQTQVVYQSGHSAGSDTYEWVLPQGFSGQSDSSSIILTILSNAVSGEIKVRGSNLCGDGNYISKNVVVNITPEAPIVINGSSIVCIGAQNQEFFTDSIDGVSDYVWIYPDGFIPTTLQNENLIRFDIQNSAETDTLFVASQNGCGQSDFAYLVVQVQDAPNQPLPISGPSVVCADIIDVEYFVELDDNSEEYLWTLPLGVSGLSMENTIELSFSSSVSNGQISVQAQNQCGISQPTVFDFIVGTAPLSIGNIQYPDLICQNQNEILLSVDEVEYAEYYEWVLPQGFSGSSDSNSVIIAVDDNTSSGTVLVTAHNVCGQIYTDQLLNVESLVEFISVDYPDSVCLGEPFEMSAEALNADEFVWSLSPNLLGSNNNDTVSGTAQSGTQAEFSVSVSNQCGMVNSPEYTIYIKDKPSSQFAYQTNGLEVTFYNESDNYSELIWFFGDGLQSDIENPVHNYSSPGTYDVLLKLTNRCGQDSVLHQISVFNTQIATHNPDFKWYPNPVEDILNLEFYSTTEKVNVVVYDNIGRICINQYFSLSDQKSRIQIPVHSLKSGVYYLSLEGFAKPIMFIVK